MIGSGMYLEYCLSVLQKKILNTLCIQLEHFTIHFKLPVDGYDGNITFYDLEQYTVLDLALQIIAT